MARSKTKTYALLALATLLFAGLAWSLNLTAFNVAGGPPVQHREIYEHRANIFLVVSIGFLAAFLLVLWSLIRNRKRKTP